MGRSKQTPTPTRLAARTREASIYDTPPLPVTHTHTPTPTATPQLTESQTITADFLKHLSDDVHSDVVAAAEHTKTNYNLNIDQLAVVIATNLIASAQQGDMTSWDGFMHMGRMSAACMLAMLAHNDKLLSILECAKGADSEDDGEESEEGEISAEEKEGEADGEEAEQSGEVEHKVNIEAGVESEVNKADDAEKGVPKVEKDTLEGEGWDVDELQSN